MRTLRIALALHPHTSSIPSRRGEGISWDSSLRVSVSASLHSSLKAEAQLRVDCKRRRHHFWFVSIC